MTIEITSVPEWEELTPSQRNVRVALALDVPCNEFSDSYSGGWEVIEALRVLGWFLRIKSVRHGWKVGASKGERQVIATRKTMAEAACLVALEVGAIDVAKE